MATSGSINFSLNRDEIITKTFKKLGILSEGETPTAQQVVDAAEDLNLMVKAWEANGLHLWAYQEVELFLEKGKEKYNIGATGDNASVTTVKTTLTADAAISATSLTVDSITGISSADIILIVLDDGTLHETTVNGAPSGSTVVITTGLASAASSGKRVYAYTTKVNRPLKITQARRTNSAGTDIPMTQLSRSQYFHLPNKDNEGTPIQYYYDPQLTNGVLYIWNAPNSANDTIRFTVQRSLEDFDAITDDPDFPQEWLEALVYNLADRLTDEYGVAEALKRRIERKAIAYLNLALSFDQESASLFISPDTDQS